jgi:hypothetical protein
MQRGEHGEDLSYLLDAVEGQEHAAATDAQPLGALEDGGHEDLRCSPREAGGVVVLRHPEPGVVQTIQAARQAYRRSERSVS